MLETIIGVGLLIIVIVFVTKILTRNSSATQFTVGGGSSESQNSSTQGENEK